MPDATSKSGLEDELHQSALNLADAVQAFQRRVESHSDSSCDRLNHVAVFDALEATRLVVFRVAYALAASGCSK